MKKIRIVADDRIPFLRESPLSAFCDMTFLPGAGISKQELLTADAVITRTRTRCNADTLDGTNVKLIATATIGYDHIDTVYCARRGIVWRNAPGCNAPSVAQYLTSLLVSFSLKYNMPLKGRVLGVIGAGNVGRRVIETASALGMTVLVNDPPREENEGHSGFTALDEICREADFITFHVPLERSGKYPTFHLADQRFLGSLKPGAVVINTSRGEVVDNPELKRALLQKKIRGAALDVWEGEPEIDPELMGLLDFATPHIAGYSADGKAAATVASVRTVARCLGLPLADWSPSALPLPDRALEFSLDAGGKSPGEVLAEAILYSYDVMADDRALRARPGLFEKLRGDYPVRREFTAFGVRLAGGTSDTRALLEKAGFNVIETR